MCILQDFEAVTPNVLARAVETVEGGGVVLSAVITQSGVADDFVMPVPVYLDYGGKLMRLGAARMQGEVTSDPIEVPLQQRPDRVLLCGNLDILATEINVREK